MAQVGVAAVVVAVVQEGPLGAKGGGGQLHGHVDEGVLFVFVYVFMCVCTYMTL
jgi:hypothetical protein